MITKQEFNNRKLKGRRRELRKNQTDAEKVLWSKLRGQRFGGLKFFRQYSVGPYILDFYCPKLRLAIELDGGQHAEPTRQEYDEARTEHLTTKEIRVLRFWNNQVLTETDAVLQRIGSF